MILRRSFLSLLAAALLACVSLAGAQAPAQAITVPLGDGRVVLPQPAGYARPEATPPAMQGMTAKLPPEQRLLAIMMRTDVAPDAGMGDWQAGMPRYLVVKTLSRDDPGAWDQPAFDQLKRRMRAQGDALHERFVREAAAAPGGRVVDPAMVGVFDEQPDSIAMAGMQATESPKGVAYTVRVAFASTTLLLRGRPLVMTVYDSYRAPQDIDRLKALSLDWARRVRQLNP